MIRFEIKDGTKPTDKVLGYVNAEHHFEAAEKAAKKFFSGGIVTRQSGWPGHSGAWRAHVEGCAPSYFWVAIAEDTGPGSPASKKAKRR